MIVLRVFFPLRFFGFRRYLPRSEEDGERTLTTRHQDLTNIPLVAPIETKVPVRIKKPENLRIPTV